MVPLITASFTRRAALLAALIAALVPAFAWAAGPAVNTDSRGVAIHGHDPVAYFVDARPVAGRAEHAVTIDGATYLFASDANRALFVAAPAKYLPQYGGYCAYGVALGARPDIDPRAFRVVDGRLYLNLNADVQKLWEADVPGFIRRADRNWSASEPKR